MSEETTPTAAAPFPLLALLSMIAGIAGIVLAFAPGVTYWVAIGLGVVAIVLSALHKSPAGKGFKITGLVTGIIAVAVGLLFMIACNQAKGSLENFGNEMDKGLNEIGTEIQKGLKEGAKAVEGAAGAAGEAVKDAVE